MGLNQSNYPWCDEWDEQDIKEEIVKKVEVTFKTKNGENVSVEILAIKSTNPNNPYFTRERFTDDKDRWEFPWTSGRSADEAIVRSLAFLHEHAASP